MITRRAFLESLAALPAVAHLPAIRRQAPALILVWLDGGMSHLDTFDCKPEASPAIRGDLRCVPGAIDGTFVSAHLPGIAARLDRTALLRSITHGEGNHDRGTHFLLTGTRPSPVLVPPSFGSVVALRAPASGSELPAYVAIPDSPDYAGAGFLPAAVGPFAVGGEPQREDFRVADLLPQQSADATAELLDALDGLDAGARSESERAHDQLVARARAMGREPALRDAFDLRREPAERRARYGRHKLGQSCLLGARLVHAGARVVVVRDVGWDHHQGIGRELTFGYPPKLQALDESVSALLDDLDGPLAGRAVVCVASEFGRTPRINPSGGRDHWPRAQSVLLAGAGVRRGVVVGRTDDRGEEPVERPLSPADLFATWCELLELPTEPPLRTQDGRPVRVVTADAEAIPEVLGG
jgi:hypothetical protein